MQSRLLEKSIQSSNVAKIESCLQQVTFTCDDMIRNVIESCLRTDIVENLEYSKEQKIVITLRLQKIIEQNIVKKLKRIVKIL